MADENDWLSGLMSWARGDNGSTLQAVSPTPEAQQQRTAFEQGVQYADMVRDPQKVVDLPKLAQTNRGAFDEGVKYADTVRDPNTTAPLPSYMMTPTAPAAASPTMGQAAAPAIGSVLAGPLMGQAIKYLGGKK